MSSPGNTLLFLYCRVLGFTLEICLQIHFICSWPFFVNKVNLRRFQLFDEFHWE